MKPEYFVSYIILEDIRMRIVSSRTKPHAVTPIKFTVDLIECVVTAATEDQEWQDAYNTGMDSIPSTNVENLHGALYYKGRLWIPTNNDVRKMICKIEHDSKVTGYIDNDKTIEIINYNFFLPGMDKYMEDFVHGCESCQHSKAPKHVRYGLPFLLELAYVS
jgi:hypothetical protein